MSAHPGLYRRLAVYLSIPILALLQVFVAHRTMAPGQSGRWFLYGRDTLAHDAVVHLWVQQQAARNPFTIPLWIPELHGGLPTLGSFLWTPFAPQAWPFLILAYPEAQVAAWTLSLIVAGFGGLLLGRSLGLSRLAALFVACAWMLSGHVVTLIHAGHFQKVMALAWLPWMLAGAVMVGRSRNRATLTKGAAIGAAGLALMILCGHPQIAWLGMFCSCALVGWYGMARRRPIRRILGPGGALVVLLGAGLCTSAPQLLPGLEMSALSNRASGVSFEEAVETSYPAGELAEFVIPRFKGSSVFGDTYKGEWGERIVSDHAGVVFVLLAVFSLIGPLWRRSIPWLLLAFFFLLVGLGKQTPLYSLLYNYMPGFRSFRSPGTFLALPALAIPVLAGIGVCNLWSWCSHLRFRLPVAVGTLLLGCGTLLVANLHFLFAFPWDQYEREFLSPTELDLWLSEGDRALSAHDAASDLSLRPILFGRRSLRGYHPITYAERIAEDSALGYNTTEWFRDNSVGLVVAPMMKDAVGEVFPALSRIVVPFVDNPPIVSGAGVSAVEWESRDPNHRVLLVSTAATTLRVRETLGPGMMILLNGEPQSVATEPALQVSIALPEGAHRVEFVYRPFSWRGGLFLGALGAALLAFLFVYSKRAVPTRTSVEPSSIATS